VWALNAVLVLLACGLALLLRHCDPAAAGQHLPWWALAAGFAAAELCVVHVHVRRSTHSLALAELPLVLGLIFATPNEVAAAWVLGSAVVMVLHRLPPVRLAFNLAQFALTALLAAGVVHLLAGAHLIEAGPRLALAVAAGVILATALSSPLILAAMALSGERGVLRRAVPMLQGAVLVSITNVSLGLAAASVVRADPWSATLLLAPAAALFVAYRAYLSERLKRRHLDFLYTAARTLARAGDPETGLAGVLARGNEGFRAEISQACLFGGSGNGRTITVGPEDRVVRAPAVDEAVTAALQELLQGDHAARQLRAGDAPPAIAAHLRAAGMQDAIVAALTADDGVIGAILFANRLGVGGFEAVDRQLLGTLAGQVESLVGQDRLGRRIAQLRETQRELEHQAFHDALTGLANRLLFLDRVRHALARREGNAAVLYIDLDDFKPINDTLGHEAGDVFLCTVGDRLRATLRDADTPARLGGDEFAVLLMDIDPASVPIVGERILRAFAEPVELDGQTRRPIHASMGIAIASAGEMDGDELIRNADAAMYASKHGGKRGLRVYAAAA
jgi:diguanylate cyclase (GGDEF)-like protein